MAEQLRTAGLLRISVILLFTACTFLALGWRYRTSSKGRLTLRLALIALLTAVALFMKGLPEERLHFLTYGLLGWMICWSLESGQQNRLRGAAGWLFAGVLVWLAGGIDECIQWWLPGRVFDIRDILFNGIAGMLGISLFATGIRRDTLPMAPGAESRN